MLMGGGGAEEVEALRRLRSLAASSPLAVAADGARRGDSRADWAAELRCAGDPLFIMVLPLFRPPRVSLSFTFESSLRGRSEVVHASSYPSNPPGPPTAAEGTHVDCLPPTRRKSSSASAPSPVFSTSAPASTVEAGER